MPFNRKRQRRIHLIRPDGLWICSQRSSKHPLVGTTTDFHAATCLKCLGVWFTHERDRRKLVRANALMRYIDRKRIAEAFCCDDVRMGEGYYGGAECANCGFLYTLDEEAVGASGGLEWEPSAKRVADERGPREPGWHVHNEKRRLRLLASRKRKQTRS